jgi:glutamine synthetase
MNSFATCVAILWVICDAYTPQGVPIPTNKRAAAAEVFAKKEVAEEVPW